MTSTVVYDFKNTDKFQGSVRLGFRLEYILIGHPTTRPSTSNWVRYAIDENYATDKNIPMWNNAILSDYDNGSDMNGGGHRTLWYFR